MDPITWSVAAGLLLKYGPEVVSFIIAKWNAKGIVTLEEWQELMALANKTPESQLADALERAGIDANSDQAKNLRALLPK